MRIKILFLALIVLLPLFLLTLSPTVAYAKTAEQCQKGEFFGLPTWYQYLTFDDDCSVKIGEKVVTGNGENVTVNDNAVFKDIWLIALAIIEMLLALAGFIAVVYVIVGGFKYVVARGNPDKIVEARKSILNAIIGAVIAVLASQVVAYIARQFAQSTTAGGLPTTPATTDTLVSIFNVVLTLLGAITVLVIVVAGLDFMFSQGEPDKIARARNTIIYALIGMVVIIFAAVIVNFVIGALA